MKKKTVDPAENAPIADDTECACAEAIDPEKEDMQKQAELLTQQAIAAEDRVKQLLRERCDFVEALNSQRERIRVMEFKLDEAKRSRTSERSRRIATIPKLVIVSLAALVALIIPYMLQTLSVIGPQLSYTIQSGLFMTIAWCMALIWDRSR